MARDVVGDGGGAHSGGGVLMGSWLRRQFAGPPPPREGFTTTGMLGGDAVGIDGLGVGTPTMGGESGPPSQLPTAFAAIKVLSGIQGNLPRVVHEREAPAMKPIREPSQRFLWGPPHMDCQAPKAWWVQGFAHFEGWANVYFWRSRLGSRDTALFALHPSRVSPFRDAQDRKRFVIDGNHDKIYTGDDILHIPGLMFDDVKGIPPVQAGAPTHALANLQGAWSRNFLRQGAGVSGIVNLEGDPDRQRRRPVLRGLGRASLRRGQCRLGCRPLRRRQVRARHRPARGGPAAREPAVQPRASAQLLRAGAALTICWAGIHRPAIGAPASSSWAATWSSSCCSTGSSRSRTRSRTPCCRPTWSSPSTCPGSCAATSRRKARSPCGCASTRSSRPRNGADRWAWPPATSATTSSRRRT